MKDLEKLLVYSEGLSLSQQQQFIKLLSSSMYSDKANEYRSELVKDDLKCPHCDSEHIKKNGTYKGKQKYVCKACSVSFGVTTGTWVHKLRYKDLWLRFIELTLESKSIRDISKELSKSRQMVLDWRHKLLSSFDDVFNKEFHGIVEIDDIYVRFNQKGRRKDFVESKRRDGKRLMKRGVSDEQVSVFMAIDRYGTIGMKRMRNNKINDESLNRIFDEMKARFNEHNVICSDKDRTIVSVMKTRGIDHKIIISSKKQYVTYVGNEKYHVNTLNSRTSQYKLWVKSCFSSVSTKYLQNYLNFYKMINLVLKNSQNKTEDFLKYSLLDNTTWDRSKLVEEEYQKFLTY